MINLEFTPTVEETSQATLDFLTNRPIMSLMLKVMKISCIFLCVGFAIAAYNKQLRAQDAAAVVMAVLWLFSYRRINRWLIQRNLKGRKFHLLKQKLLIDSKGITASNENNFVNTINWKSVKFVLKNPHGYIVPLTGFANAGRFFWIPFSSLQQNNSAAELDSIMERAKIKINKV